MMMAEIIKQVHDLNNRIIAERGSGYYACPSSDEPADVMDVVYSLSSICSVPDYVYGKHNRVEAYEILQKLLENGWIALEVLALACTIENDKLILFYARSLLLLRFDVLEHLVHMNRFHHRCFLMAIVMIRTRSLEYIKTIFWSKFCYLDTNIDQIHLSLALKFAYLSHTKLSFWRYSIHTDESILDRSCCIGGIVDLVKSVGLVVICDTQGLGEDMKRIRSDAIWEGSLSAAFRGDQSRICYNYLNEQQDRCRKTVPRLEYICTSFVKKRVIGPCIGTKMFIDICKALEATLPVVNGLVNFGIEEGDDEWISYERIKELHEECEGSPKLLRMTISTNADLVAATDISGYKLKGYGDFYTISDR